MHAQKDGKFYVGVAPLAGRINGSTLTGLGDLVEKYGAAGARLTAHQKIVVLGVDEADVEALRRRPAGDQPRGAPSNWRRSTMACTGIEFCKLAIVDTKQRAVDLVAELEQRFPDLDTPITVNVNGCPNACARTQVADIGLKGMLVLDDDGDQVEGFQVHLGGASGLTRTSARSCAPTRSPAPASTTTSPPWSSAYLHDRKDDEPFADWAARADEDPAAWRDRRLTTGSGP